MRKREELVSLSQYAEIHQIPLNTVRQRVYRHSYKTAHKIGSIWVIDKNDQYKDGRIRSGKLAKRARTWKRLKGRKQLKTGKKSKVARPQQSKRTGNK